MPVAAAPRWAARSTDSGNGRSRGAADGQVECGARAELVEVACFNLRIAVETRADFRLGGLETDGARGGIAAPERALRTTQCFHTIHVQQQARRCLGTRRIYTVDKGCDFGIGVLGLGAVVAD